MPTVAALLATVLSAGLAAAAAPPRAPNGGTAGAAYGDAASAPSPSAAVVENAAVPAALRGRTGELTPLVADFDGDKRSDVLFYGPGSLPDHLWLGRPGNRFAGVPLTVRGTFHPIVGDFDGDRRADVFWYAPGAAGDQIWFGGRAGNFRSRLVTVSGTYEPLPGDFDGNGRTDVFWYGPGAARDVLWLAGDGGRFRGVAKTVGGSYRPLLADFDADGRTDLLWYGPGTKYDLTWYGAPGGAFASRRTRVGGSYEPVVGDFDGDGARDVLWYGPGEKYDVLWYGARDRAFTSRAVTIAQAGVPVTADYDADGRRDLLVYDAGGTAGAVHYGRPARGGFRTTPRVMGAGYAPVAGDFGGDGAGDVFWYGSGDGRDVVWGGAGGTFVTRETTIDVGHPRSTALRPEALGAEFATYGYVGHAMGGIQGHSYTNSIDAFRANYERGFRVFEADHVILRDGTVFVAHDGTERYYGLSGRFPELAWGDVAGAKWAGQFDSLRAEDLVALLREYPDAYFILDFKTQATVAFATYVRLTGGDPALMSRLIPHVADQAMVDAMREVYPLRDYVVALYRTQWNDKLDDPELLDWVRRERVPAVMMWHRQRDFSRTLAENNMDRRRYDARLISGLRAAGAVAYVHTVDTAANIEYFASRAIGVYTNFGAPPDGESPESPAPTEPPGPSGSPPSAVTPGTYGNFVGDEG